MPKVDLHTHTCYSDGSFTPEEVVKLAKQRKLSAVAITDHDTVSGVSKALKAGKRYKVKVIPGIEFSAKVSSSEDPIHLLGYFIDHKNKDLIEFSQDREKERIQQMKQMLKCINKHLNINIKYSEVKKKTKGIPCMPHLPMVMHDKGIVPSIYDGIKLFLKGAPCNLPSLGKIHAKQAIEMIHNAGGVAVLAHIFAYKNEKKFKTKKSQEALVKELKSYGLVGLEVIIPKLKPKELEFGKQLCKKYNLVLTGGSDFHSEKHIPQNVLGGLKLDYKMLTELRERLNP